MIKKLSPLPRFLTIRYKNWKSSKYINNSKRFKELASKGQNPSTMVISCCDSRLDVTSIFGAKEGDFFVYRNIANLIPAYKKQADNYSVLAAIEYGIYQLRVKHLIILGHRGCGGIKNAHKKFYKKNYRKNFFLDKWLNILESAFDNIPRNISQKKQINLLEEEGVKISAKNVLNFPNIDKLIKKKSLKIHGLIHDIGTGELKYYNPVSEEFEKIL